MTTAEAPKQTGASFQFITDRSKRTVCFGPPELGETFGVTVPAPAVPALFSESVIERALELDCAFVQQVSEVKGKPLTLQYLHTARGNADHLDGRFLYGNEWYQKDLLFTAHTPRSGLFIKGRSVISGSVGKTFIGESLIAADFVQELFGDELPEAYGNAIKELRSNADALEALCCKDWQEGARRCAALAFSRFFRESPVEVLFRVLLAQKINRERLFEGLYTRTNVFSPFGGVVGVGDADADGAFLAYWGPEVASGDLGFSFSCSGGELKSTA